MKAGDVILPAMETANGRTKARPVVALCEMPRFGDWLVCGVSSQLHQEVPGFDEVIVPGEGDGLIEQLRYFQKVRSDSK